RRSTSRDRHPGAGRRAFLPPPSPRVLLRGVRPGGTDQASQCPADQLPVPLTACATGTSPPVKSMVAPIVDGSASTAAATAATSWRLTVASLVLVGIAMLPVPGSSVSPLGPRTVQSNPLARRCASAAALASA